MKKKKNENYLDNVPVINGDICWEEDDDKLIVIKQKNKGFYSKIAQKFFDRPKISNIHLDEFGSFVWKQIDGEKDIAEIVFQTSAARMRSLCMRDYQLTCSG